jgi:DNA replication and repair protein RecF
MVLNSLEAVNFRNLKPTQLTFSPQINIFFGHNAQGKTNLIEAIYLLSFFKSFRAEADSEMVQWDQKECYLKGDFDAQTLSIEFKKDGKEIRLNHTVKRALEVLGELRVVSFSPEDILILTGAPSLRRRFIDSLISTLNRKYLYDLANLQKVLKNRNRVLYFLREGRQADLSSWDDQLIEYACNIWLERARLIEKLNQTIKKISAQLMAGGKLDIGYQPKIELSKDLGALQARLRQELDKVHSEEIRRATTLIGPQRDDFNLVVEEMTGEKVVLKDIGIYGSRGEQRVGILSLKLAEISLIEAELGERPILLLDDVLSEFDQPHREHLFTLLGQQQTFITTTELSAYPEMVLQKARLFEVKDGVANPQAG